MDPEDCTQLMVLLSNLMACVVVFLTVDKYITVSM